MKRYLPITTLLVLFSALFGSPAFAGGNKVDICHIPPGNPTNWHTITVSVNAQAAHLAHGDFEGSCLDNCETLCSDGDACTQDVTADFGECVCLAEPTPVDCNDGNPCTFDSCSPAVGACVYDTAILEDSSCDDGDPATPYDLCRAGACTPASCPCIDIPGLAPLFSQIVDGTLTITDCQTEPAAGATDGILVIIEENIPPYSAPHGIAAEFPIGPGEWFCGRAVGSGIVQVTPEQGDDCAALLENAAGDQGVACTPPPV